MKRIWLLATVLAFGAGLFTVAAQPPEGRKGPPGAGDKGPPGGEDRGPPGEGRRGEGRRERPTDPAVEAWVKTLAEKITDPHDEIRESARAGLIAVGRTAIPTLRLMLDGPDGAKATAARKVMEQIETAQQRPASAPARNDAPARPDRPTGNDRPDRIRPPGGPGALDAIFDDLDLNDKQRNQIEEIMRSHHDKMRELNEQMETGTTDREKAHNARRNLHDTLKKNVKDILTAEQYAKFEEAMSKLPRPSQPGERPPGERPPQP